ncbi:unnamed protein product, partial [marine sediment metagenome]
GKSAEDVTTEVLRVGKGLVWRIEVEFPPGCAGLAHLRISDGLYQVFPATPGETFASDGTVIGFDDLYLKNSAPYEFVITAWNEDEAWTHTLQVRVAMASSEAFMSRYMPSLSWDKFNKVMQQAAEQQQRDKDEQLERLAKEISGPEAGT